MKLSTAKPKTVGLQLGEASLNFIHPELAPIRAKLAILAEEGEICGYLEKSNAWSEKTMAALQALAECIEEDALPHIFLEESPQTKDESRVDPPQF